MNQEICAGVTLTDMGLSIRRKLSESELLAVGRSLNAAVHSLSWAIADFLNYVEDNHGDLIYTVADIFGLSIGTLRNMTWTARAFPMNSRSKTLSFTHHRILAGQPENIRQELLKQCERENWTTRELYLRIVTQRCKLIGTSRADTIPLPFEQWYDTYVSAEKLPPEVKEKHLRSAFIAGRKFEHERMMTMVRRALAKTARRQELIEHCEREEEQLNNDYLAAISQSS